MLVLSTTVLLDTLSWERKFDYVVKIKYGMAVLLSAVSGIRNKNQ